MAYYKRAGFTIKNQQYPGCDITKCSDAPTLHVEINRGDRSRPAKKELSAKIDTGAFISVVPERVTDYLNIYPSEDEVVPVRGYDQQEPELKPIYVVGIRFLDFPYERKHQRVIVASRENMLIGRDILNTLCVVLRGKKRQFDIHDFPCNLFCDSFNPNHCVR